MTEASLKGEPSKWFFESEYLQVSTPTIQQGVDRHKELSYRQQAAQFVQDMGQRLQGPQWCLNTAIVFIQRFYVYHSFKDVPRNDLAAAALFLAGKVEEFPRKLEHVVKVSYALQHRDEPTLDTSSDKYLNEAQKIVMYENLLLTTLGFDLRIEHPHTHVVKCCQLIKAPRDLAQASYFLATDSLLLTTFCLRFRPTVVACICIHLACKWANWEIPLSQEGRPWYFYVDPSVTEECLRSISEEFVDVLKRTPSKLRTKLISGGGVGKAASVHNSHPKSAKSELDAQSSDEHADLVGDQREEIIGYNMASVPGSKPHHLPPPKFIEPLNPSVSKSQPSVSGVTESHLPPPPHMIDVKPLVDRHLTAVLHQPATKPRPGATSPNNMKRIKTEPGTLNVLDLSAYKERAKERVKDQQPPDKTVVEGTSAPPKPTTTRPSFIPDTSKGSWMTPFVEVDNNRNSLVATGADSKPPVPHHHQSSSSSKDPKDRKRSEEERRKYEDRKRHQQSEASKDDKKRQKIMPEGAVKRHSSDLNPQKSESSSSSHQTPEQSGLKSGRTVSDMTGHRVNGMAPHVKNGTSSSGGSSHHHQQRPSASSVASNGNKLPSNPVKPNMATPPAKFGFNSPPTKVPSLLTESGGESLKKPGSQSKSPMGSLLSHRPSPGGINSGSHGSQSGQPVESKPENLSEVMKEESMDLVLEDLEQEKLMRLQKQLRQELLKVDGVLPSSFNGDGNGRPTGGQSHPYSPATGQSMKSKRKDQLNSSPMTSFTQSEPHGIQLPMTPGNSSSFSTGFGSILGAPPPPPPLIPPPLPPCGDAPPPPPPPN